MPAQSPPSSHEKAVGVGVGAAVDVNAVGDINAVNTVGSTPLQMVQARGSFFEKIPRKLNILEEEPVNDRYSTQPNLEEFVFIRMLV